MAWVHGGGGIYYNLKASMYGGQDVVVGTSGNVGSNNQILEVGPLGGYSSGYTEATLPVWFQQTSTSAGSSLSIGINGGTYYAFGVGIDTSNGDYKLIGYNSSQGIVTNTNSLFGSLGNSYNGSLSVYSSSGRAGMSGVIAIRSPQYGNYSLFTTSNGGGSFSATNVSTQYNSLDEVNCVYTRGDGNAHYVVSGPSGFNQKIYRTTNGGASWSEVRPEGNVTRAWQYIVTSDNGNYVYAVRNSGVIRYSTNGGSSWQSMSVPKSSDIQFVSVSGSGKTLMIVYFGDSNTYMTRNYGASWSSEIIHSGATNSIMGMSVSYYGDIAFATTINRVYYNYIGDEDDDDPVDPEDPDEVDSSVMMHHMQIAGNLL